MNINQALWGHRKQIKTKKIDIIEALSMFYHKEDKHFSEQTEKPAYI